MVILAKQSNTLRVGQSRRGDRLKSRKKGVAILLICHLIDNIRVGSAYSRVSISSGVYVYGEKIFVIYIYIYRFIQIALQNSLWQKVSIGVFDDSNGKLCAIRLNMLGKHMKSLPYEDNSSKHSDNFNIMARVSKATLRMLRLIFRQGYTLLPYLPYVHRFITMKIPYSRPMTAMCGEQVCG